MAIKVKCSECKSRFWAQKSAITCSPKCRAKRQRRVIREKKDISAAIVRHAAF